MDIFSIADDIFQRIQVVESDEGKDDSGDESRSVTQEMIDPSTLTGACKMITNNEIDIDDLELYSNEDFLKQDHQGLWAWK